MAPATCPWSRGAAVGLCVGPVFPEAPAGCLCLGTSDPPPYLSSAPADVLPILRPPGLAAAGLRAAPALTGLNPAPAPCEPVGQPHSPDPQPPARARLVLGGRAGQTGLSAG